MNIKGTILLCAIFMSFQLLNAQKKLDLITDYLSISIDNKGSLTSITDRKDDKNYLAPKTNSALLSLFINKKQIFSSKATFSKNQITLTFPNKTVATINVEIKPTHITFELSQLQTKETIDAVIWGPYFNTINQTIGETIGVVQNDVFGFGIQALNPKTLGGFPWNDHDHLPQIDIFAQDDYEDFKNPKGPWVLYSVEAAKPWKKGSSIQAYTRNRQMDRKITNLNHDHFMAPTYQDGGLIGSKIAIFGSPKAKVLDIIGDIEIAEGLPHPMIDGVWVKKSKMQNSSYLIMDFHENEIDKALEITNSAGLNYLYHGDPFETWGHYGLRERYFPSGIAGLKNCVDKANQKNVNLGTHTLTNFINTEDTYVSPIPHKGLAIVGSSELVQDIGTETEEILIKDHVFFSQFRNNSLRSFRIGDEIIKYDTITTQAPFKLMGCKRGAYGTVRKPHKANEKVHKLLDHGYNVFLGNAELNKEIAENIATIFNQTGIRMLDFDGLEGAHSTGMGNYGEVLFVKHWYDKLSPEIKKHVAVGASRSGHYFWHYYARMNWGEPWYAGFRESQTQYRLANQKYYQRNLMPGMLGWFKMTASTSLEDIEWLLARSVGYNAGFALVTDFKSVQNNGQSKEIFNKINLWETARLNSKFPSHITEPMQDVKNEYQLFKNENNTLSLYPIQSVQFKHQQKIRQPGEPVHSTFSFNNTHQTQPLSFILTAENGSISDIVLNINGIDKLKIPLALNKGEIMKYENGKSLIIFDKNWNVKQTMQISEDAKIVTIGKQSIDFDCNFESNEAFAKLELVLKGKVQEIK